MIGALAASLEQAVKVVCELREKGEAATRILGEPCERRDRVDYEGNGLQVKQQLVQREWEKYVDSVDRVQCIVSKLQECVAKNASALQGGWKTVRFSCAITSAVSLLDAF